ncbi:hypothetical protein [uncultured Litoreibacter sp.]|uniref:hypothetical protein n=1 Tax=uncultured Litoreibacter sp. TaxID=1392394 RepID=UPI00260D0645|nr:hypothetical protein [uncultured Litoreibacter sp.]
MSASDDIQFDMSAALVGVMVVLFYLVYDETKFEQSPGEGTARIELFYIEEPLSTARYADFTWPVISSDGAAVGNPIYSLNFNASFEGYEYASNEVHCQLDNSVQAVWHVNTAAPTLKDQRGYQGVSVAGDVALEGTIDAQARWSRNSTSENVPMMTLTALPNPWSTRIPEDDFRRFIPADVLAGRYLLPSASSAAGSADYLSFYISREERGALGRRNSRSYSYIGVPDNGGLTVFNGKDPNTAMEPELLRGILRHPFAQSLKCSLTGQSIHAAQQISVYFDPPGCGIMGGCASGFQNLRLLGLRYRTPQGRQWVTWDFSQGTLEDVKFTPNATPNADGTYTLTGPTRISVELN